KLPPFLLENARHGKPWRAFPVSPRLSRSKKRKFARRAVIGSTNCKNSVEKQAEEWYNQQELPGSTARPLYFPYFLEVLVHEDCHLRR
ncbi:MAG: hypothetical protein RR295_09110, partial [Oscillospiraceae bacterium]